MPPRQDVTLRNAAFGFVTRAVSILPHHRFRTVDADAVGRIFTSSTLAWPRVAHGSVHVSGGEKLFDV